MQMALKQSEAGPPLIVRVNLAGGQWPQALKIAPGGVTNRAGRGD